MNLPGIDHLSLEEHPVLPLDTEIIKRETADTVINRSYFLSADVLVQFDCFRSASRMAMR